MSRNKSFLFLTLLKFTMPIIYIVLGIVLLIFRDAFFAVSGAYRTVFGIALIGYGALRLYQTYIKERTNEK